MMNEMPGDVGTRTKTMQMEAATEKMRKECKTVYGSLV